MDILLKVDGKVLNAMLHYIRYRLIFVWSFQMSDDIDFEDKCLILKKKGYTQEKAAKKLKVSRRTVVDRLKKKGLKWSELERYESKPLVQKPTAQVKKTKAKRNTTVIQSPPLKATLSKYIQDVMNIQSVFVGNSLQCTVKDAMSLRDNAMQFEGMQDIPSWTRPPILNKRQNEIVDVMVDRIHQVVAVEGGKRTGKSTSWFIGVAEGVWEGRFKKVGVWAAGQENAIGILNDVFTDAITVGSTYPLFKGMGSRTQKVFFNNAIVQAHSNNVGSTSGLDFDCVVIDECHKVIEENPEIFAMIAMTLRAKPNLKIILTMNQGTGAYQLFKRKLQDRIPEDRFKFFTLNREDTEHITDESDEMVRVLVEASTGKEEAKRWLDNKFMGTGDTFDSMFIIKAYENYEIIRNRENLQPHTVIMGIDPADAVHPVGWWIGAISDGGEWCWELESGEINLARSLDEVDGGEKWTKTRMEAFLMSKYKEYRCDLHVIESNSGGIQTSLNFNLGGCNGRTQNFGSPKSKHSRESMIGFTKNILESGHLLLKGDKLQDNMVKYDPNKNTKNKFKGDIVDAMLHAIFRLMYKTRSPYMFEKTAYKPWYERNN